MEKIKELLNNIDKKKIIIILSSIILLVVILLLLIYIFVGNKFEINKEEIILDIKNKTTETIYTTLKSKESNKVTFTSTNENIATVDKTGKVTSVSIGETTVTVRYEEEVRTVKIIVVENIEEVKTTNKGSVDEPNKDKTPNDKTSNVTTDKNDTTTNNGDKPGENVSTLSTQENENNVTTGVTRLSITETMIYLNVGKSKKLTLTVYPKTLKDAEITWTSSNKDVAIVDEEGKVTGINKGTAVITAMASNGKKTTCVAKVLMSQESDEPLIIPANSKRFTYDKYNDLKYYLYIPNDVLGGKVKTVSLVVYLHSYVSNAIYDYLPSSIKGGTEYPAIIVIPELNAYKWHDIADKVVNLADYISDTYNINKNKISITGVSWGGNGAIEVGTKFDSYFSCIVLVGGGGYNTSKYIYPSPNLNIPVWGFGDSGGITGPTTEALINNIKGNGRVARYTLSKEGHSSVGSVAYKDCKVIDWMVKQDKRYPAKSINHECPITKRIRKDV